MSGLSLPRLLVAHRREYLRAVRLPPDARLYALISHALTTERQQANEQTVAELQTGALLMQARFLHRVVEAGQEDVNRIMADFEKDGADQPALLAQARQIQAAVQQAVKMLEMIQSGIAEDITP